MKPKRLFMLELSDVFGNQVYLPYSSGVVLSYAFSKPHIKENYELIDWLYYRDSIESMVERIEDPDIVGFSCFVWNWQMNLKVAKIIKEKYPECLIVFGGQQQPLADRVEDFFDNHPYVDILVHGEGEVSFVEILEECTKEIRDYSHINGISYYNGKMPVMTFPRPRMDDIDECESPYLDGLFDKLMESRPPHLLYNASVESTRGCPFSCAFCEIGERYYVKVKKNYGKIKKEIDWIVKNKIEYITDANSNFGLYYKPDMDLAEYVKEKKEETGYPHAYRVTWVKGKADKVLDIAKVLEEAGVQKGMTIALQSMNQKVLDAIMRKNVDGGKLKEFIEMYEGNQISSYVELIWGLPEETLESFIGGVCEIMELDYHNYLDIHLMAALINTPFSRPDYIEKYGLEVSHTQPRFHHRHIRDKLSEDTTQFVTKSNTFTQEEWIEGHQFRWLTIFGHYLGPTQYISRFMRKYSNVSYEDFYTSLLEYIKTHPDTLLGEEYTAIMTNLNQILDNKRHWGIVIPEISNINWSVDEATAIKVAMNYDIYEFEMTQFLLNHLNLDIESDLFDDMMNYQRDRMNYIGPSLKNKNYQYNIHDYLENDTPLLKTATQLQFESCGIEDYFEWAKKIIWFSRRTGGYKTKVSTISPENDTLSVKENKK
jgi:putative methyltransferase